jgi:HK97 family phage prohead protease
VSLKNFLLNNVALFNHDSNSPIGKWLNVRLVDNQLLADLEFLPQGLSPRVDEIRAMAEHDILKAVSIGFMPLKTEPILNASGRQTGVRFLESELCEISLVAVPALAEALAVARNLKISRSTMAKVFTNGALISEHIATAKKAVAQAHKHAADVANIERKIEKLWRRITQAVTEQERQELYKQVRLFERMSTSLTPEHLRTTDQKQQLRADALRAEKAKNDRWGVEAAREEYIRRMTEHSLRKEREAIEQQKREGRYVDDNPPPSSGNTVTWRGQKIDLTPTWRGRKIF